MNCKSPTTVAYEQTDVGNVLHPIFDSQSTADLRPEYEDVAFGSKDERRSMGALPAKGKEYPGLGYKRRLREKPLKAQQQQQQPAEAQ
ncbi:hypothetical protein QJQ45_002595 [Haematococcus lacustris]|nr:hypothetical protein QJQ45_002595 [Haematococcus lacustris]